MPLDKSTVAGLTPQVEEDINLTISGAITTTIAQRVRSVQDNVDVAANAAGILYHQLAGIGAFIEGRSEADARDYAAGSSYDRYWKVGYELAAQLFRTRKHSHKGVNCEIEAEKVYIRDETLNQKLQDKLDAWIKLLD